MVDLQGEDIWWWEEIVSTGSQEAIDSERESALLSKNRIDSLAAALMWPVLSSPVTVLSDFLCHETPDGRTATVGRATLSMPPKRSWARKDERNKICLGIITA